jgi:ion channel
VKWARGDRAGNFRYGGVLLITVAVALYTLAAPDSRASRGIELIAAGAMLVFAVATSNAPRATRRGSAIALGVAVIAGAISQSLGEAHDALSLAGTALVLAGTAATLLRGLTRLVIDRGVVLQAVLGALAVYVLIGLVFAFTIGAIAVAQKGAYFTQGTDATQSIRVYFSFTVLTTTGFGDYTAATKAGHALAVLEMLLGQLYLVTVIALLVGNLRRREDMTLRGHRLPPSGDR